MKTNGYILMLALITSDWLNDVIDVQHHTVKMSAGLDRTALSFHIFCALYTIKSSNHA